MARAGIITEAVLGRLFYGRAGERIYFAYLHRCWTCLLRGSLHD